MDRKFIEKTQKGFTMVELMAVLVILGLLFGLVAKNYIGNIEKAKVITTKTKLKGATHAAVVQFKMDTGRFPTEDEGLNALIEKPSDVTNWEPGGYLQSTSIPKDGWKNDFIYRLNPESGKPFDIISYGADGQEGDGENDNDKDLSSTDAE